MNSNFGTLKIMFFVVWMPILIETSKKSSFMILPVEEPNHDHDDKYINKLRPQKIDSNGRDDGEFCLNLRAREQIVVVFCVD